MADTDYYFDVESSTMADRFFGKFLTHVKGDYAGSPFVLDDWQRDNIINPLFGTKRVADHKRRYRTAYIEVPRKNGKSTLAAGIALFLLFMDPEYGSEIYSAAGDRDQAAIVFETAKKMVEASPELRKRCEIYKRSIVVVESWSVYRVLSSDAFTKHGLNAHGVIFDELHVQPNRELWDVLTTSTGARSQPLIVAITTAGYDRESVCYEQREYALKVQNGLIQDDSFFSYILSADPDSDWTDESVWAAVNPGLGRYLSLDYLRKQALKAVNVPAYQNTFRRLHLNQWTSQADRWLDLGVWDGCGGELAESLLKGGDCYGGLDLASTSDLASLVLVFPSDDDRELYSVLPFFWVPKENMIDRSLKDRVPYDAWARDGLIRVTEGNVIDYEFIIRSPSTLQYL